MATIEQRRARAARRRIDQGKKPFTDTKPTPRRKTPVRRSAAPPQATTDTADHDRLIRFQDKALTQAAEALSRVQGSRPSSFDTKAFSAAKPKRKRKAQTDKVTSL